MNKILQNKQIKIKKRDHSQQIYGMLFAAIPILGFIIFGIVPLVFSLIMSFSEVPSFYFNDIKSYPVDKLFTNYIEIFQDEKFYIAIKNTLYVILSLPLSMIIGLVLAVILNQKIKGSKAFRTIFFIPYVCSIVAISLMWRTMLDKNYGVINQFLSLFGIENIAWLTDPKYFMPAMIIMITWCNVGFNLILYSAALTGISPAIYEAAEIDGANALQRCWYISVPELVPLMTMLSILAVGNIFRGDFGLFYQIPRDVGALYPTTDVIDTYVYRGLRTGDIGITSAVGFFQSFVGVILVTLTNAIVRKIEPDNAMF